MLSWHGGVDVKKNWLVAGTSVALAFVAGSSSFALEEQKSPPVQESPAAAAAQPAAPVVKSDKGTEIRLPGIGKIGTLPKMDFGLELLYGATETEHPNSKEPSKLDDTSGGATIRGEIKHRF